MALVSLRDLSARLRVLEAARVAAPLPVPPMAAPPAPAPVAPEQDLAPAWAAGADHWLTCHAVKLAGLLNMGGTARICPNDGIDAWDATGLYRGFAPDLVRRLRAAGLLPKGLG